MSMAIQRSRHQGDPGLFGFLGKAAKKLGRTALGFAGGGVGAATGAFLGRGRQTPSTRGIKNPQVRRLVEQGLSKEEARRRVVAQKRGRQDQPFGISFPAPGPGNIRLQPFRIAPGGEPFLQRTGAQQIPEGFKLACPGGFHPNKSDYFTKSEGFIPEGTKCVKNRRRNPANPRALDRALSRLNMAKRLQNKLRQYSTEKYTKTGKKRD